MKKDGMCMYESKQLVYIRLVIYQIGISKKRRMVTLSLIRESHSIAWGESQMRTGGAGIISRNICHGLPRK